jgi:hypothetical protein
MEKTDDISSSFKILKDKLQFELLRDFQTPENLHYIQEILNSNSHISVVLNQNRQVVLSNLHIIKIPGIDDINKILGDRPGDVMGCIHSSEKNGCGLSDSCRYCGIVSTILESQKTSRMVSRETRITTTIDGLLAFHDFRVTCNPMVFNSRQYVLLNLIDISSEKRNQMLENVFFHDILNRLGGLNGIVQIMKAENQQPAMEEYIDILDTMGELVIEDIQTQRFLKAA